MRIEQESLYIVYTSLNAEVRDLNLRIEELEEEKKTGTYIYKHAKARLKKVLRAQRDMKTVSKLVQAEESKRAEYYRNYMA